MSKPRLIKDYDKIDAQVKNLIHEKYPHGFEKGLISFFNAKGKQVSALPFETDKIYYLIRMTRSKAQEIQLARQAEEVNTQEVMELDSKPTVKAVDAGKKKRSQAALK